MRAELAKHLAERDARSRDNKRLMQGRVVGVNPLTHTVRVDVKDSDGTIMEGVPYTGQTPPNVGDVGDLVYSGSSNHSVRFANPRLSSGHTESDFVLVGGVQTFNGAKGAIVAATVWDFFRIVATSPVLAADASKLYVRVFDDAVTGRTLTLPDPTLHFNPIWVRALAAPAGGHTLARHASEKIDNAAADLIFGALPTQISDAVLISDHVDWWIFGERIL